MKNTLSSPKYAVGVFVTNVSHKGQAEVITTVLHNHFPGLSISFDLEDCDRVLRIEHDGVLSSEIIDLVRKLGFHCDELRD
jgi:hypothetical protein